MNGMIYMLIDRTNGLEYIGQTVQSITRRMAEHQKAARYGSKTRIAEAIREHGWENFDVTIIEDHIEDAKALNYAEARYIVEHQTYWPDGYNMTFGGSRDARFCKGKKTPANMEYVDAYKSGLSLKEVADRYGVSAACILKHVRKAEEKTRKPGKGISADEVIEAYRGGMRICDLVRKFGVSRSTIKYHLRAEQQRSER